MESTDTAVDEEPLHGRQAKLVFALLVLERDRPVHRDELAAALWPQDRTPTWDAALRGVISKIRTFLTTAEIPGNAHHYGVFGGYQLHLPSDVQVDVESACLAIETAENTLRDGHLERTVALAKHARTVAERPFLPGAPGRWAAGVRDRLDEVLSSALCVMAEGYAQWGRYPLAVRTAEQALSREPFRERTYQLLMRVHVAAGNPAEALRTFNRCRRLLADELGAYPAAETAGLHVAVLRGGL